MLISIGGDREDNAEYFEELESVGRTESRWFMPYERGRDVWIARKPKVSLEAAWPGLKQFIGCSPSWSYSTMDAEKSAREPIRGWESGTPPSSAGRS